MKLSPEKCKFMHSEKQKDLENYFIARKNIDFTECERDLGVLVSSDGTWHEKLNSAARIDQKHI